MGIKYWAPRHRNILYSKFDEVRLSGYCTLSIDFIKDMLAQKLTQKALKRIEDEWEMYFEDISEEQLEFEDRLFAFEINKNEVLLITMRDAENISQAFKDNFEEDES